MEERQTLAVKAQIEFRRRICDRKSIFSIFSESPNSNYSKLKFIVSNSVTEGCNNSVLLLGPRGCGQKEVLDLVIEDLKAEYHDMISVVKLDGILHSDDNCALKEIAKQLCLENQLLFSKMASSDDNSQFMIAVLREYGLAHKTVIFVLDEFDLFAQGKQRLLYSLLDAMQSVASQAVVVGVSCRLDADQLLEKRVRSRFSHRKLLFLPPNKEDRKRQVFCIIMIPFISLFDWRKWYCQFCFEVKSVFSCKGIFILNFFLLVQKSTHSELQYLVTSGLMRGISIFRFQHAYLILFTWKQAFSFFYAYPKSEKLGVLLSTLTLSICPAMRSLHCKSQRSCHYNAVFKDPLSIHKQGPYLSSNCSQKLSLKAWKSVLECSAIFLMLWQILGVKYREKKLIIQPDYLRIIIHSTRSCGSLLVLLDGREQF
ncbi:hypothetical protein Sjap_024562 [Stephania japonica]|uniref:Origin of replication complex subunit 4 n=1 Tax=Stephania japonica TaxID=461633 RepID=A0AAP0EFS7_9MAGN